MFCFNLATATVGQAGGCSVYWLTTRTDSHSGPCQIATIAVDAVYLSDFVITISLDPPFLWPLAGAAGGLVVWIILIIRLLAVL